MNAQINKINGNGYEITHPAANGRISARTINDARRFAARLERFISTTERSAILSQTNGRDHANWHVAQFAARIAGNIEIRTYHGWNVSRWLDAACRTWNR